MSDNLSSRASKLGAAIVFVPTMIVVLATNALAATSTTPPYTASSAKNDTVNFVGELTGGTAPIMLAVAGACIGVVLLSWGIKTVYRKVTHTAKV